MHGFTSQGEIPSPSQVAWGQTLAPQFTQYCEQMDFPLHASVYYL